ncbi:MAG: 4Fe-4S binding protein [Christensenellales bacterium]
MAKLTIDKERCKGCGLCVMSCPKGILALSEKDTNKNGYFILTEKAPESCIGCANCAIMCPDSVITVER